MKLLVLLAVILAGLVGFSAKSRAATATYTPSITVSAYPQVGVVTTFTTESNPVARIQWSWQYPYGGSYKVGGQMGEGTSVNYAFPSSASSKPYVVVVVKVTSPGGTNNFVIGQRAFSLTATVRSSLWLESCSYIHTFSGARYGIAGHCVSQTNAQGLGQQRHVLLCQTGTGSLYFVYGSWVNVNQWSTALCFAGDNPQYANVTIQKR